MSRDRPDFTAEKQADMYGMHSGGFVFVQYCQK
jgi:hypothetical protein